MVPVKLLELLNAFLDDYVLVGVVLSMHFFFLLVDVDIGFFQGVDVQFDIELLTKTVFYMLYYGDQLLLVIYGQGEIYRTRVGFRSLDSDQLLGKILVQNFLNATYNALVYVFWSPLFRGEFYVVPYSELRLYVNRGVNHQDLSV